MRAFPPSEYVERDDAGRIAARLAAAFERFLARGQLTPRLSPELQTQVLTGHLLVSYYRFGHQTVSHARLVRSSLKYASTAVEGIAMRDVYSAVADPTRRRLLNLLAAADELPLHEITAQFGMGRTAISKHLSILKEAGLVSDRKVGRETRYHLNPAPLREIQDWVTFYERFWTERIDYLKTLLEEDA